MTFQEWFNIGMKRPIPEFLPAFPPVITVGGREVTDDRLYRPHWDAMREGLPFPDASQRTIFCNHFLEHLPGERAVEMLREFERVLRPHGTINLVTPYYNSHLQAQDPDHRSAWNESSWGCLFRNNYYSDHGRWSLRVHACFIAGIVERNLSLFTQLVKDAA
jgi:SAM-dependent methyltransferase